MIEYDRNNLIDFCEQSKIEISKHASELCRQRDELTRKNKDVRHNYDNDLLLVNHDYRVLRMLSDVLDRARDNLERNIPAIDYVYFTLMTTIDYAYQALAGRENIRNISDSFYLLNAMPHKCDLDSDDWECYQGLINKATSKYDELVPSSRQNEYIQKLREEINELKARHWTYQVNRACSDKCMYCCCRCCRGCRCCGKLCKECGQELER